MKTQYTAMAKYELQKSYNYRPTRHRQDEMYKQDSKQRFC